MSLQLLLYVSLSLWIMRTMVFAVRLSKLNCPEECGIVKIPFPFGIGEECSGNSSFTIDCRNITNRKKPFLRILDLEVLYVNLYQGIVTVNQPASRMNFSSEEKYNLPFGKSLLGTPFNLAKYYGGHVPLRLDWEFKEPAINNRASCCNRSPGYYDDTSESYYPRSYDCNDGFEGNPYLEDGCQDINACVYPNSNKCGKSRVKMALIGVGAGLGALVLLVGAWRSYKVIKRRIKANRKHRFFKRNGGLLLEQQLSSTQNGVARTKLFSSNELEIATDHFNVNRILGRGGQGTVYKAMLSNGIIVAVKKSQKVDKDDLEVFINEVVILSQINHRNVVKLLGCCLETEVPLLVYELIPNDTLFQHIHNPTEEFPLTWERRLRIASEVASALSYLHSAASFPIYHRDIKSTNILLDDKYRAKVSDFGTSRSVAMDKTHLTTKVIGTFGYLDPEYFQSSQFTEKSDVYSFGVVMVELLTGQKAISSIRSQDEGKSLATNFLQAMEENCLHDILDAGVLNDDAKQEIMAIAQLARRCLYLNGKRRPTMKEVATELQAIQMSKQGSSSVQDNIGDADAKRHSIVEVSEVFDFASIPESIHFDNVATSDVDPLLFATP